MTFCETVTGLVKKYGPVAARWFGGPAAGAIATAVVADKGAFAGVRDVFGNLVSAFGKVAGLLF